MTSFESLPTEAMVCIFKHLRVSRIFTRWVCHRWRNIFIEHFTGHGKQYKICLSNFTAYAPMPIIEFLDSRGCPRYKAFRGAIKSKRLDVLKWLIYTIDTNSEQDPLHAGIVYILIKFNELETLDYVLTRECPINIKVFALAAERNELEILDKLKAHPESHKYIKSSIPAMAAAKAGHKGAMLKCRAWSREIIEIRHRCRVLDSMIVSCAAQGGHFDLLIWCLDEGYSDIYACNGAVRGNQLDILEWLRNPNTGNGQALWSAATCRIAAASNPELLTWLRDPDTGDGICPWDYSTFYVMARRLDIAKLEWLRDPNTGGGVCPWDRKACYHVAAMCVKEPISRVIEVLTWLRNPDTGGGICPWDQETCKHGARNLDLLKWLRNPDTGGGVCPWDKSEILTRRTRSLSKENRKLIAWVKTQPE